MRAAAEARVGYWSAGDPARPSSVRRRFAEVSANAGTRRGTSQGAHALPATSCRARSRLSASHGSSAPPALTSAVLKSTAGPSASCRLVPRPQPGEPVRFVRSGTAQPAAQALAPQRWGMCMAARKGVPQTARMCMFACADCRPETSQRSRCSKKTCGFDALGASGTARLPMGGQGKVHIRAVCGRRSWENVHIPQVCGISCRRRGLLAYLRHAGEAGSYSPACADRTPALGLLG